MTDEPSLEIGAEYDDQDKIVRIALSGSLCFDTYEKLETHLLEWIDQDRPSWIVDLGGVIHISTVAAAGFVGLLRVAQDSGGRVFVIEPSEQIADVFRDLDVHDLMPWVGRGS